MIRIGSALFNADHTRLGAEVERLVAAGIDFLHFDVFDGRFVPDLAFPPRTIKALRPLTALPFEVHLAAEEPLRFLPSLAEAGTDLVFLPAESTPLLYEAIYAVREQNMRCGLCLALGTSLSVLEPVLPLLDAVLLLGRVTGEGNRGRQFNDLLLGRITAVRHMIDQQGLHVDLQAAGGLETASCQAVVEAGARSLPLGGALHREPDMAAYLGMLRTLVEVKHNDTTTRQHGDTELIQHSTFTTQHYKVLVASRSFGPNCPEALQQMRAAGCELIPNDLGRAPTEDELLERIGEADVLISGTEPVTARVLAAAPRLKIIAKHGVGYENIDLAAARERGIPVALAGGAIADSVADLTLGLMLALVRQIPLGDRTTRAGEWRRLVGVELRGKTLGIVGLGQIGKQVARRARAFGMTLVAHDAYPDAAFARSWALRYLPLDELLATSDIVTLHAPVTHETRGLIGTTALATMQPSAYLINTARGELVDETALYDALRQGRLAGAATDVFLHEPPRSQPLLTLDNFVVSPHIGGQTQEGLRRMGEITAENVLRVLSGLEPHFRVA